MTLDRPLTVFPIFGPVRLSGTPPRLHALDGIRGWASLMVVCFHMIWETFGNIEPVYKNPYTATFLDGELAVSIFFVLSGEALSVSFFSGKGRRGVIILAIKRYPRLVIPIFMTSLITLSIYFLGVVQNAAAGQIVHRTDWLGSFMGGTINLQRVLKFSFYDVFVNQNALDNFIPFLWTMRLEFIGSLVVFVLLYTLCGTRFAWPLIGLLVSLLLVLKGDFGQIACFLAGICFAQMRLSGIFAKISTSMIAVITLYTILFLVITLDGYSHSQNTHRSLCEIYAILVVFCFSSIPMLRKFMEGSISQLLGRASFPLFLMQFPIIISFTSISIIYADKMGSLHSVSLLIALSSVVVCILAAVMFEPIEVFTKIFCREIASAIMGDRIRKTA